jgi:hypothetical protein
VAHVRAGERHDRRRHRGREQHRLAQLVGLGQQPLDVGQEAEVQHLVGLVEHEQLHVREVERAPVGQVEEAARRADDDVDAGDQGVQLRLVRDSAIDGEHPGAAVLRGDGEVAGHLQGELAGRCDHEGLRLAAGGQLGVVGVMRRDQSLQHWDRESEGLAGTCPRLPDHVRAQQRDRESHLLDGECFGDADLGERVGDLRQDAEIGEGGQGLLVSKRVWVRSTVSA